MNRVLYAFSLSPQGAGLSESPKVCFSYTPASKAVLKAICKTCLQTHTLIILTPDPWREGCKTQWEQDDHLSLVAKIQRSQMDKPRKAGIRTVADLAATAPETKVLDLRRDVFLHLQRVFLHAGKIFSLTEEVPAE